MLNHGVTCRTWASRRSRYLSRADTTLMAGFCLAAYTCVFFLSRRRAGWGGGAPSNISEGGSKERQALKSTTQLCLHKCLQKWGPVLGGGDRWGPRWGNNRRWAPLTPDTTEEKRKDAWNDCMTQLWGLSELFWSSELLRDHCYHVLLSD